MGDCRALCTMYRTGTSGGNNGPNVFVMQGIHMRSGYTDMFLEENGAEPGSTIQMTKKAFMTKEAWLKMTPKLVKGYRDVPIIRDNPLWYCVEIFDGFGVHLSNFDALKMRFDALIISIKEEGDASSINQAYDKLVTRSDKRKQRDSLGFLRQLKGSNNFIDQWCLIHVSLTAVCYTKKHGVLWINSFVALNLHPRFMLAFEDWFKNISPFMMASDLFNLVMQSNVDEYHLLPALWQAMSTEHKGKAVEIF